MNTYGVVILIVITIISSYIIILHYKNITQNITLKKNAKKEGIVPTAYYYLIGFTLVCVYLKIHALRKYTMKKLSDIFLTQFLIKKVYVQGVPKKIWFKPIFEFLTLEGVFLGVKNNSKNFGNKKNIGLFSKILSKWTLFYWKSYNFPKVLRIIFYP